MILDYNYNKKKSEMQISYINEKGGKDFIVDNVERFVSYRYDENGPYKDAFGKNVSQCWSLDPSKFDLKNYIFSLPEEKRRLLMGRTLPKLYTFDIETDYNEGEFPEADKAEFPITAISVVSPNFDCIVLGTNEMSDDRQKWVEMMFNQYLNGVEFFKELNLKTTPKFKYIKFETEEQMIRWFFKNIIARVPIIAGWNSIQFDWQYFQNRVERYYPNIGMWTSSARFSTTSKNYKNKFGGSVRLKMPDHTLVMDMQELIEKDKTVLPIKESMSLDWISEASLGVKKVEYTGSLKQLYNEDFAKYVYYNAIDSILVQLIDHKFKTLVNYYLLALYCNEAICKSFSPIAMTEALFYKDFYEHDYKVVYEEKGDIDRGQLIGAYVKVPTPGKYEYTVCNDFASLYPSTIITCNISVENFLGKLNPADTETIAKYKADPNYFVTVNNSLYKNDKEYSFKRIQRNLKETRAVNKYLSKKLYAAVIADINHIQKHAEDFEFHDYDEQMTNAIATLNMPKVEGITCGADLLRFTPEELEDFKILLSEDITFYTSNEQAIKLLMNSMYGGCSHVFFYWFNMYLANDITGEARNLTLLMESHLSNLWTNYWWRMRSLHKKLGIELKPEYEQAMMARDKKRAEEGFKLPTTQDEYDNAINNFHKSVAEALKEKEKKSK